MAILSTLRQSGRLALLLLLLGTAPSAIQAGSRDEGLRIFIDAHQQAVTLQLPATAPRKGLALSLLDSTGHIIYHKPLNTASGPLISLPVSSYGAGIYLLMVEGPNGYNIAQRMVLK